MPGDKLLICIAFHYIPDRLKYVMSLLERFSTYDMDMHIIIDTNKSFSLEGAEICVHDSLEHPYHLTWIHRQHFKDNIDNYDWFMYVEDDMDVPFENFITYTENFKLLWPSYIPSFVRIERFEGKEFNTDNTAHQHPVFININNKTFTTLGNPYHAFWIMPQKELKSTMLPNFVRREISRETAASYPMWGLRKKPLVMIENGQVSPLCYSYHLANNYAPYSCTPFGKIEISKLLK